jgi:hypothetical protein
LPLNYNFPAKIGPGNREQVSNEACEQSSGKINTSLRLKVCNAGCAASLDRVETGGWWYGREEQPLRKITPATVTYGSAYAR